MYLAKLTTAQAKTVLQNDPIVVIPVGSTEQHGPQCALGTDFMIPSYLADRIADLDNVLVVPAVPYGVCPYHMSFAGSIDLGYEGLYTVLRSIAFSLMQHGARRFLVLNGHGGNNPSIDKMALEVYHAGGICASIDWWSLVGQLDPSLKGGHGDFLETSAMMVVDPESVHLELCQPMNAHDPSENAKAAWFACRATPGKTRRAAGSVPATPNTPARKSASVPSNFRSPISATLWRSFADSRSAPENNFPPATKMVRQPLNGDSEPFSF